MNKNYFSGKHLKATEKFIKQIENEKTHKVKVMGKEFDIFPSVFSPKYFKDPEFFVKELPIKSGETFLEIGCGSGTVSVFAIFKGASSVTSIDINPSAVANTKHNARLHGVEDKIKVYKGDVFSPLSGEKFDTIFWNTPWGMVKKKNLSPLETALWDTEYKSTEKFIKESKGHLNKGGRLLIGFSSTIGDLNYLKQLLEDNGYDFKIIKQETSKSVDFPASFEIIESRPRA